MSEKTTDRNTEEHAEAKKRVELKEGEMEIVQGGIGIGNRTHPLKSRFGFDVDQYLEDTKT